MTSPDTSEYEKIKKDLKKHVVYISLQEIEEMPLNKLYSYDTFLKMDILKKIIKPKNFSLILLEEVSDKLLELGSYNVRFEMRVNLSSLRPYEVRKQGINNTIKGRRMKKSEKQK